MELGEKIKHFRKLRKLTQSELAEITGIPRSTIQKYESGQIHNVSVSAIEEIAEGLETNPADLVGWHSAGDRLDLLIDAYLELPECDQLLVLQLIGRLVRERRRT